jgi:hypothetical protein
MESEIEDLKEQLLQAKYKNKLIKQKLKNYRDRNKKQKQKYRFSFKFVFFSVTPQTEFNQHLPLQKHLQFLMEEHLHLQLH